MQDKKTEANSPSDHISRLGLLGVDLVFDDDDAGASQPSSASVESLWREGDRSLECAVALASLAAQDPSLMGDLPDQDAFISSMKEVLRQADIGGGNPDGRLTSCLLGLGAAHESRGELETADGFYKRVLDIWMEEILGGSLQTSAERSRITEVFNRLRSRADSPAFEEVLQAEKTIADFGESDLTNLRKEALEAVEACQFRSAELMYRHLVKKEFELGSTHCHLARLYFLMKDRLSDIPPQLDKADRNLKEASCYVELRVIFLRMLLGALKNESLVALARRIDEKLGLPGATMSWTIGPVLERLQPRLRESKYSYEIFVCLAQALCSEDGHKDLAELEAWKTLLDETN